MTRNTKLILMSIHKHHFHVVILASDPNKKKSCAPRIPTAKVEPHTELRPKISSPRTSIKTRSRAAS